MSPMSLPDFQLPSKPTMVVCSDKLFMESMTFVRNLRLVFNNYGRDLHRRSHMKIIVCICAGVLFVGCAHYSDNDRYRGSASPQSNVQTGNDEDYFPYRSGPGLPSTDRAFPRRTGPGGLGTQ